MEDDSEHGLLDAAKGETPVLNPELTFCLHSNIVGGWEKSLHARIWALTMPSHF